MFTTLKRRREFKIFVLLGITFAIANFEANKAQAQTAIASGSATLTSGGTIVETFSSAGILAGRTITNGIITSVSGETVLPSGYFFNSPVVVTPTFGTISTSSGTVPVVNSLTIAATPAVTASNSSFSRAAAEILTNAASTPSSVGDIDQVTAIIRAGAGVNGLD
jgi:hypothetical protein